MLTDIRIVIHTTKGDIDATLFPSKAPVTAANFLNLASRKFYDGLTFHRVVPRFVIQGGDPLGTGTGGPGYRFENEINASLSHENVGVLAMANAGPDTNGSQFYVTIDSLGPGHVKMLDGNYSMLSTRPRHYSRRKKHVSKSGTKSWTRSLGAWSGRNQLLRNQTRIALKFIEGGAELLDNVRPLWKRLNALHAEKSPHFAEDLARRNFWNVRKSWKIRQ